MPLLDAVGDDRELMSQVITMFINSTRNDVSILREAIAKNDSNAVKSTAHHLKGSLLELSAKDLVAMALRLEQMGSAQQLADAGKLWQQLDVALRDLVTALDQSEFRHTA
jgi:HPt (histidine-containing phosphotransfer) domain-containing protein